MSGLKSHKPSVTVVCHRCREPFEAPNKHHRCCVGCRAKYDEARREALKSQTALRRGKSHTPRQAPYALRPDFLLYLPLMRAELERQTRGEKAIHVEPSDPREISSFRVARQRRGSGNGPQDAA